MKPRPAPIEHAPGCTCRDCQATARTAARVRQADAARARAERDQQRQAATLPRKA